MTDKDITIGNTMVDSATNQKVKILELKEETDSDGQTKKMVKVDYDPGISWVEANRIKTILFG
jgi:hypothetical protein